MIWHYIWNNIQAFDRQLNALLGGTDKEYLSSRIYRYREHSPLLYALYKCLNAIDKNHCERAFVDAQIGFDPNDEVIKL